MKKIKFKRATLAVLFVFSIFMSIGVGFSKWILDAGSFVQDAVSKQKIDNIAENYHLPDNIYTVYFFPQPVNSDGPAPELKVNADGTKSVVYNPKKQKDWGYWEDATDVEDKENGEYGYKKLIVEANLNADQINGLGNLKIDRLDSNPNTSQRFPLSFSGWTANQAKSKEYAAGQASFNNSPRPFTKNPFTSLLNGFYDYVDFSESLKTLNNKAIDGTKGDNDDKVIFLYPVYTTGKSYNNQLTAPNTFPTEKNADQMLVKLETRTPDRDFQGQENRLYTKSYYFNQIYDDNSDPYLTNQGLTKESYFNSYYSYTGLRVSETDRFDLMFAIPGSGGYDGTWRTFDWGSAQINNNVTNESTPKTLPDKDFKNVSSNYKEQGYDTPTENNYFLSGAIDNKTLTSNSSTFLADGPGTYNIYVYLKWTNSGSTDPKVNENTNHKSEKFESLSPTNYIFSKTARYVRLFDGIHDNRTGITRAVIPGYPNLSAVMTVKVEKIEEPKLLTWDNSNYFQNENTGASMFRLGNTSNPTSADSYVKDVSGNTKAIDYYAFNVRYNPLGNKKRPVYGKDGTIVPNAWYDDSYMAFNLGSSPVKNYVPGSGYLNYYQTMTQSEVNKINNYTLMQNQFDFDVPSGPKFANDAQMQIDRKVQLVHNQSNITVGTTSTGDATGLGSIYSLEFAQKYDYHKFFKPTNPATNPATAINSTNEYHIILRLYYTYSTLGFNNWQMSGFSLMVIPYRIRRLNVVYFIKKQDWDQKAVKYQGLVDLKKTIPLLTEYYISAAYYRPVDLTQQYEVSGNQLEVYSQTGAKSTFAQLYNSGAIKNPRDSSNESQTYTQSSPFDLTKTTVVLYD